MDKEIDAMVTQNERFDIVEAIGGIATIEQANALFKSKLDETHLSRILHIKNPKVLLKIANAISMCEPDRVYINTGSEEDRRFIRKSSLEKGEEAELAMEGHTIHFDLKDEQGRIVDRTYYIYNEGEAVSSLANKMLRDKAHEDINDKMKGIMRGKIMVVGFYSRGPVGAPASNPALEITSSLYVSHSAEILYRNSYTKFDAEVDRLGHFFTNIHSEGLNRAEDLPNARVFMDRVYQTTYAFNCTYAGNTLLLKKGNHRFAVDKAVLQNKGKEIAEHMFITGIENDKGRITWFTGAAPSGCGKTTTAMAGHHFIGDDLSQMWIAQDGSIRSINPECGIFGIVEDVNWEGDPKLMEILRKKGAEVIWSNVLIDENKVPHWVGNGEQAPGKGFNFQGEWTEGMKDKNGKPIPLSHPNARCTISSTNLDNYSPLAESPEGVETRVITYSGRDSDTMPPIWVAKNPDHGVVIGACIVSAATATEVGASGVKRAPWANAPFIPGSLGEYMEAQFLFFNSAAISADKKPVMAGLNYFLTHEARGGDSKKLLGEKRDVKVWLTWLEKLAHNEVKSISTPIGFIPLYEDLKKIFKSAINKDYPEDLYTKQFSLYIDNITDRLDLQIAAYGKEGNIPGKLFEVLEEQKQGLMALKEMYGPIVKPSALMQQK